MSEQLLEYLDEAFAVFQPFVATKKPSAALILGSGLNSYAEQLEEKTYLDYRDVPHMGISSAEGHVGRFVLGRVPNAERYVLCMQGRLHAYEGFSAQQIAFPVWLMQRAGVTTLVTTNAAGALNPSFCPGSFCLMSDHINLTGRNPLVGKEPNQIAQRFLPMIETYDVNLRTTCLAAADATNVSVYEGVYLAVLGPNYETPAEVRLFASWGADTVAMSVVEEVIAARHVGMRVMGLSFISNMACGIKGGNPTSEEVTERGLAAEKDFASLMNTFFQNLKDNA